jgi:hypothetical protein
MMQTLRMLAAMRRVRSDVCVVVFGVQQPMLAG